MINLITEELPDTSSCGDFLTIGDIMKVIEEILPDEFGLQGFIAGSEDGDEPGKIIGTRHAQLVMSELVTKDTDSTKLYFTVVGGVLPNLGNIHYIQLLIARLQRLGRYPIDKFNDEPSFYHCVIFRDCQFVLEFFFDDSTR